MAKAARAGEPAPVIRVGGGGCARAIAVGVRFYRGAVVVELGGPTPRRSGKILVLCRERRMCGNTGIALKTPIHGALRNLAQRGAKGKVRRRARVGGGALFRCKRAALLVAPVFARKPRIATAVHRGVPATVFKHRERDGGDLRARGRHGRHKLARERTGVPVGALHKAWRRVLILEVRAGQGAAAEKLLCRGRHAGRGDACHTVARGFPAAAVGDVCGGPRGGGAP